jgi:hypothetical protein
MDKLNQSPLTGLAIFLGLLAIVSGLVALVRGIIRKEWIGLAVTGVVTGSIVAFGSLWVLLVLLLLRTAVRFAELGFSKHRV